MSSSVNTLTFLSPYLKFAALAFGSSWDLPPLSSPTFFSVWHNKRCIRKVSPNIGFLKETKKMKDSFLTSHALYSIRTVTGIRCSGARNVGICYVFNRFSETTGTLKVSAFSAHAQWILH